MFVESFNFEKSVKKKLCKFAKITTDPRRNRVAYLSPRIEKKRVGKTINEKNCHKELSILRSSTK